MSVILILIVNAGKRCYLQSFNLYYSASIFPAVKSWFDEKEIPLENLVSCATDGAASMVGRHKGFITYSKRVCPEIIIVRCIVHQYHLVAKNITKF